MKKVTENEWNKVKEYGMGVTLWMYPFFNVDFKPFSVLHS